VKASCKQRKRDTDGNTMKEGSERVEKLIGREGIGKQQSGQLATGIG